MDLQTDGIMEELPGTDSSNLMAQVTTSDNLSSNASDDDSGTFRNS